jgi:hypothetical protein
MKNIGIWIDTREARVIRWDGKQSTMSSLFSGISKNPKIEGEKSKKTGRGLIGFDYKSKQMARYREELQRFYKMVLEDIQDADKLFIVGPAESKHSLEKMILRESARFPQISGVEPADKITDNQLRDKVIRHFTNQRTTRKLRK